MEGHTFCISMITFMCVLSNCVAFLEVKNALVKLAYCVTECTVCRPVVACGAQCLLVSAVLTNNILVSSLAKFYICSFSHYISLSLFGSNGCCNLVPSCCARGQVFCHLYFFNSQLVFLTVLLYCAVIYRDYIASC